MPFKPIPIQIKPKIEEPLEKTPLTSKEDLTTLKTTTTEEIQPKRISFLQREREETTEPQKISFLESPREYLWSTIKHIPGSLEETVGGIATAIFHPIRTIKTLGKLGAGAVEKVIPGKQKEEEVFDRFVDFLKQRYGSWERFQETFRTDPVGTALDLSIVFGGSGALMRRIGQISKVPELVRAGEIVAKTGKTIEPLGAMGKGVKRIVRPITKAGGEAMAWSLGVSTGQGGEAIKTAFRMPGKAFTQALRGKTTGRNILTVAREGLQRLKDKRTIEYQREAEKILKKLGKKPVKSLDISPIFKTLKEELEKFNIKVKGRELDFSRSPIDKTEVPRVKAVIEIVRDWGLRKGDRTPYALDILKRKLDDFYTPSREGATLIGNIRKAVKKILDENVPGYKEMTKKYAETSELIKEIEKTLSLKPGSTADTALRKLTNALKADNELRQALLEEIDRLTPFNIKEAIAGHLLHPVVPTGLIGRSIWAEVGGAGLARAAILIGSLFEPLILSGIVFTSPRIVGEFVRALGLSHQAAQRVIDYIASKGGFIRAGEAGLYQVGRLKQEK